VGFRQGTAHLAKCLTSGITGALKKPAEGYSTGGFKGFAQGMAYGVAGLICKPTSGLLDLIANTTEGITNQVLVRDAELTRGELNQRHRLYQSGPELDYWRTKPSPPPTPLQHPPATQ